ncbi:STAS domain-containing protein [Streptomyces sp. URMC 129]|uniref:STAS domain-containing protein n=1 Tax=Streptomyces sp. URMC 129 TaxID=3423407 RepID=UPI003F1CB4D8
MTTTRDSRNQRGQVVRLSGELDLGTQAVFGAALRRASRDTERPWLVVDLRAVTFMDCIGLREVCAARASCLNRVPPGWVRLVYTAPAIGRLLEAAGLAGTFPRYATVSDAWRDRPAPARPPRRAPGRRPATRSPAAGRPGGREV